MLAKLELEEDVATGNPTDGAPRKLSRRDFGKAVAAALGALGLGYAASRVMPPLAGTPPSTDPKSAPLLHMQSFDGLVRGQAGPLFTSDGYFFIKRGPGLERYVTAFAASPHQGTLSDPFPLAALQNAVADVAGDEAEVWVTRVVDVTANYSVPSNVTLRVTGSGLLRIATGTTLTVQGAFDAPIAKVFAPADLTARVEFAAGAERDIHPEWWGAKGNGSTDDYAALYAALDSLSPSGGSVRLQPRTYMTSGTLPINSRVHLRGAGVERTEIKLMAGANVDIVRTVGFDGLTGTDTPAGPRSWSIEDLNLNGNKVNNLSAGYGLRVYGYGFKLRGLHVRDCRGDGIYSEWSTSSSVDGNSISMEAIAEDIVVHDCGANGITWGGPHDSMWVNIVTYLNGGRGNYVKQTTTMTGGALVAVNCHSWGLGQTYAWDLEAPAMLINCQGEGASLAQLRVGGASASLLANDTIVRGGQFYAAGGGTTGIIIGVAGVAAPAGYDIDTKVNNCTSGAINFVNDGGIAKVRIHAFQISGAVAVGTPSVDTYQEYHVSGGATGRGIYPPSELPLKLVASDLGVDSTYGISTLNQADAIRFKPGGLIGLQVIALANAVNFPVVRGGGASDDITIYPDGSSTDIDMVVESKGAGHVQLRPGFTAAVDVPAVASAVNLLQLISAISGAAPVVKAIGANSDIDLGLGVTGTGVVDFQYALVSLGGGSSATLGTIGGSGPAVATQDSWMKVKHQGTVGYVPVWR
jgi:hypothetical protein